MHRFTLLVFVLAGCGAGMRAEAAPVAVEMQTTPPSSEATSTAEAPAPSSCFEASTAEVLDCTLADVPRRPASEVVAAWRAHREPPSGRRRIEHDALAPRALDAEERSLVAEMRAERCARIPEDPQRAEATYQLARMYYESNLWDPAVALFEEVAIDPSAGELAPYAASLALDALNLRLVHRDGDARRDCLARFQTLVASFEERLCRLTIEDEGLCEVLERLAEQIAEQRTMEPCSREGALSR